MEVMGILKQRPSITVFIFLQILDVLTTLIGLRLGAGEASAFVGSLMHLGLIPGLMISKILAVLLVLIALRRKKPQIVVMANIWFAGLVTWNLLLIFSQGWKHVRV
jgi:hypothetical protein